MRPSAPDHRQPRQNHRRDPRGRAIVAAVLVLFTGLAHSTASAAQPQPQVLPRLEAVTVSSGLTHSVISSSVSTAVSVTPLPDGRVVVLQKGGSARIIKNGVLLATPAITLSVCSQSERGLLGLAVDPAFHVNRFVYVYYTRAAAGVIGGCVNRVSRFTMSLDTIVPSSEVVLLDNIGSPAGNHNGGDLEVGNDGFLYVAVGDGGCDPRDAGQSQCAGSNDAAQDLSLLNGKILRVDRATGAPAPGNPFLGAGTAVCRTRGNGPSTPGTTCREIYAYGLRNPWRFAFDYDTGATRFYINDVGQNTREEINLGVLGANYGWPMREGDCAQGQNEPCPGPGPGITQPISDYSHASGDGEYITGGAFVPDGAWDSSYDGGYLFADGNPGEIKLRLANGNIGAIAFGLGGISDIAFVMEPGGWVLYYVNPSTNTVGRIAADFAAPYDPPELAFSPVLPAERAFDSRSAGADTGMLRAGTSRFINVTDGGGVHQAALVNITAVSPQTNGYVVAWEPRNATPPTANLNVSAGQVAGNTAVVPVDFDGNISVFSAVTTHLVIDVMGLFDSAGGAVSAGRLVPVAPVRALDTREPNSGDNVHTRSSIPSGSLVNLDLGDRFGLSSASTSVALMVTALAGSAVSGGVVTAAPGGGAEPETATVNIASAGDIRANMLMVPLGVDGSIDLRLLGNVQNVIVDVVGYFTDGTASPSSIGLFTLSAATRPVDTRENLPWGRRPGGTSAEVDPAAVPAEAIAVVQNIAIVQTGGRGYVTAYPGGGGPVPLVANGNSTMVGQTRSTMAITQLNAGSVAFYTSMATDLVVDVSGWFEGPIGSYSVDSLPE